MIFQLKWRRAIIFSLLTLSTFQSSVKEGEIFSFFKRFEGRFFDEYYLFASFNLPGESFYYYTHISQSFQYPIYCISIEESAFNQLPDAAFSSKESFSAKATESQIILPNSKINQHFILLPLPSPYCNSKLVFPFKFKDFKYSLIHRMKNENIIDHLSFSVFPSTPKKEGKFYFGSVSKKNFPQFFSECKVLDDYHTWSCALNLVSFDGTSFIIPRGVAYFDYGVRPIVVPGGFYSFLEETINRIFNFSCSVKVTIRESSLLHCPCSKMTRGHRIVFSIEGVSYPITLDSLVKVSRSYEGQCEIMIEQNTENDHWIFGSNFLENYVTTFDYEEKKVVFFSDTQFHKTLAYLKEKKALILVNTFFLVLSIVMILCSDRLSLKSMV